MVIKLRPCIAMPILMVSFALHAQTIFPKDDDLHAIKDACGAGSIESVSAKTQVDAAIKNWKQASVDAEVKAAKQNLTGALGNLKGDEHVEGVFKIYVACLKDTIQQFMDDANKKAPDVTAVGSATIVRNAFSSDQEAEDEGCKRATKNAIVNAKDECSTNEVKVIGKECPAETGGVRTYTSRINVKCVGNDHVASEAS
ncbi:hypothetical protein [Pseudomonas sp. 2(2015)]|uniref:hypothetical protein n=1 Tax=Pseudomonas sp. 2(2015) TaxID=1619950 RepID=UPI000A3F2FE7|nr:hypothetical protein [Pseudomonas sp. 2(2015)]